MNVVPGDVSPSKCKVSACETVSLSPLKVTAGDETVVKVELFDSHGNKVPASSCDFQPTATVAYTAGGGTGTGVIHVSVDENETCSVPLVPTKAGDATLSLTLGRYELP